MNLLLVVVGGGIGAGARYLLGAWVQGMAGPGYPWGTFLINTTGAFLIGIVLALVEAGIFSGQTRLFVAVGVLGGYTTFSTLSYDTIQLILEGDLSAAMLNSFGQVAVGILAAWLGIASVRVLELV